MSTNNNFVFPLIVLAGLSVLGPIGVRCNGAESAGAETKRQQIWEGPLDVGGVVLRLRFEITMEEDGGFSGHLISLDQGNVKVPLSSMSVDGDEVEMEFKSIGGKFVGKRDKDNLEVVGRWTQYGNGFDYSIKRADAEPPRKHTETWQGTLEAGQREFNFQLRIQVDEKGKQHAVLDSFSERKLDLPTEFEATDDGFSFRLPFIKASFSGKYNEDRTTITGEWQQLGELPLELKKIPIEATRFSLEKRKRPQHPLSRIRTPSQKSPFEMRLMILSSPAR